MTLGRSVWSWLTRPLRFTSLALAMVSLAVLVVATHETSVQGDTWWALRAGKEMWQSREFIRTDSYSFTAFGDPWPNHSWLYQVLLYAFYVVGGFPLLTMIHAALPVAAMWVVRPRGPITWADVLAITPLIALISASLTIRPMVLSMLMTALVIRLLHAQRWLGLLLVMLIWANLHGGVAVGGLLVVAAAIAALVAWLGGLRRGDEAANRVARRRFLSYLATAFGCAAATLVNPMGWGLWRYVITASARPGQEWIAEWQPSWTAPFISVWFWAWCALFAAVVLFRWKRLAQWPVFLSLCLTLAMLPLAWESLRNIAPFAVVSLPLMILLLRSKSGEGDSESTLSRGSVMPGAPLVIAVAVVAAAVSVGRAVDYPNDRGWEPMTASIRKAIERCPGNVYTTYNSGAFLIWWTPSKKVFVDNRQDPYARSIINLSVLTPQTDYGPAFAKYGVTCAAILADDAGATVTLGALGGWQVVANDGYWVVFSAPDTSRQGY